MLIQPFYAVGMVPESHIVVLILPVVSLINSNFHDITSVTLTKDTKTNTRRFTYYAKRVSNEPNTVYVWNNATTFIAVTVDWTQYGKLNSI